jgi:hypothetical protein
MWNKTRIHIDLAIYTHIYRLGNIYIHILLTWNFWYRSPESAEKQTRILACESESHLSGVINVWVWVSFKWRYECSWTGPVLYFRACKTLVWLSYTYTCMYIYMHMTKGWDHAYVHTCKNAERDHKHIHIYFEICYACIYIYTHTQTCVCVNIWKHMQTHICKSKTWLQANEKMSGTHTHT